MSIKYKMIIGGLLILLFGSIGCGSKKKTTDKDQKKDTTVVNDTNDKAVDTSSVKVSNNFNNEIPDDGINVDPNASPENVVKTVIKAAKTGKYGLLAKLCNEAIDMDGDAKDICDVASSNGEHQKSFNDYFGNAKIVGKARIKNGIAEVDIETTEEGRLSKETIVVQVKYDKWYLKGL